MPEPAFLVDGVMEQRIIGRLCPNKPIRRIDCNGRDVALDAIVERVDVQIRFLNNKYYPIIILIDRETRKMSCDDIRKEISLKLDAKGHQGQYIVGVVDRCIENWILADWKGVCSKFGYPFKTSISNYEGKQGKSALKRLLPGDVLYHEPTWGKEYFLSCNPEIIYQHSRSFKTFVDMLNVPCEWLNSLSDRFLVQYPA